VATGTLEGNTLTNPWHGFQYDIVTALCLVDPMANLDTYPVSVRDGEVYLQVPDPAGTHAEAAEGDTVDADGAEPGLQENEFRAAELLPGQMVHLCRRHLLQSR
jgi:hypothetical protein